MERASFSILYEDGDLIVCEKPHGLPTQTRKIGEPDMVSLIRNHIGSSYLAPIHRLDQPVRGILVFAKTPAAARELNRQLQTHGFGKYYRALTAAAPSNPEGTLKHWLCEDGRGNFSRICSKDTPGAKCARLHYRVVSSAPFFYTRRAPDPTPPAPTELDICLNTGRRHQIRVQLAAIGCPIIGDRKYNAAESGCENPSGSRILRLCAYRLDFVHPRTRKPMHMQISGEVL